MGTFLSEFAGMVDRLSPVLLDTAARSVAVLGLAGLMAIAMRRASAAARHWVWLLGFVGLLLLPVLSATLPGWRILPRMDMTSPTPIASVIVASPALPVPAAPVQIAARIEERPAIIQNESPTVGRQETMGLPAAAPLQGGGRMSAGEPALTAPAASLPPLPWTFWLVILWLAGSLLVLGHVLLGHLSLWLLQRRCARVSQGDLRELLSQLRRELHVHRAVELLSTPLRTMPMTWGLWRTRLLLPEQAESWTPEQRRSVLLHELGHVMRCDCPTQFLAQVACALYWFNPLVWIAWNRMQIERERACDDLVLGAGAKASAYAEHLLHSASAMPALRFVGAAALAMARPSTLEERLRAILDSQRNRGALTVRSALATVLLLAAALVPVAALNAQERPANEPAAPAPAPVMAQVPADPNQPALSLEERLRQRREQEGVGAVPVDGSNVPTTRPATAVPAVPVARGRGGRGGGPIGMGGRGSSIPLAPGEGPTCSLDATIYDVRLPVDQIGRIDLNNLMRVSATPEGFEKALAEMGATLPLYRANQSVRLASDSITIGSTTPYVSNSTTSARGQVINTIAYATTGAIFHLAGVAGTADRIELDLSIEVSSLFEGTTEMSPGVKPPVFRNATMSHKGRVTANQPFVLLSVDAGTVDSTGKAVAYIARITMGPPRSGPAQGE